MTDERKTEIIGSLLTIAEGFSATDDEPMLTMFGLISRYNATGNNSELIGGDWVVENVPELANLP